MWYGTNIRKQKVMVRDIKRTGSPYFNNINRVYFLMIIP